MEKTLYSEIAKFKIRLLENNWLKIIQNVENESLGLFKIIKL